MIQHTYNPYHLSKWLKQYELHNNWKSLQPDESDVVNHMEKSIKIKIIFDSFDAWFISICIAKAYTFTRIFGNYPNMSFHKDSQILKNTLFVMEDN